MKNKDITRIQVEKVASLARLELGEAEAERFAAQLGSILAYMEKLEELDVEGVEPLTHVLDLVNVTADDEPVPCLPREVYLANAPCRQDGLFLVPPVIE